VLRSRRTRHAIHHHAEEDRTRLGRGEIVLEALVVPDAMPQRAQRPWTMAIVEFVAIGIRLAHVVAQLGGARVSGPAAHHRTADPAFTAPAFLADQYGNAVALPFQSDMRGDVASKDLSYA